MSVLGGGSGVGCRTSISSPLVAGIVGLMRTQAPFATSDEIVTALTRTALTRPVAGTRTGVVDAAAALRALGSPEPRLQPVVLGRALVGEELEARTGIWSGTKLAIEYQWERCRGDCTPVPGATGTRYRLSSADHGSRLRVVVSAGGLGAAASSHTDVVLSAPRLVTRPSISGRPRVGAVLFANRGRWQGTILRFIVNWQRCRESCVQVATGRTYRPKAKDRGARMRLEVIAHNSLGAVTALSARSGIVR